MKTTFNIIGYDGPKIQAIKALREASKVPAEFWANGHRHYTALGLKEAKALIDDLPERPFTIQTTNPGSVASELRRGCVCVPVSNYDAPVPDFNRIHAVTAILESFRDDLTVGELRKLLNEIADSAAPTA